MRENARRTVVPSWVGVAVALAMVTTGLLWFQHLTGKGVYVLTAEYTRALASGHSSLAIKPDPQLLALADPYDPQTNAPYRLIDAILYRGKYYLYYGTTPFLTVLVPWYLTTGKQLSESVVITGYAIASSFLAAFLLWDLGRKYAARASAFSVGLAAGTWALCSAMLSLIRLPRIYELVIASACFHDVAAVVCCHLGLHYRGREKTWLALAALNAGLAVNARASHLPVAAAVGVVILVQSYRFRNVRSAFRTALICGAPLVLIGAGMAWYNWTRFGKPLDFGYRYVLQNAENFANTYFSARYLPFNLWHYFFGLPQGYGWFPFYNWSRTGPIAVPDFYYSLVQAYGIILVAPYLVGTVFVLLRWRACADGIKGVWLLTGVLGLANLILVAMIDGATYRYEADFLVFWGLTGAISLIVLADRAAKTNRAVLVSWGCHSLAVISIASNVCLFFSLSDIARRFNPNEFETVARIFNQPRLWWEQIQRRPLSAYLVTTVLPSDKFGHQEPLLVTGRTGLQDFIYLTYVAPGFIQVGFESIGGGGPTSNLIAVDYRKPVEFEITLGSEFPPAGAHPYAGLAAPAVEKLRNLLIIKVNGQVAIESYVAFHLVSGFYYWGRSPDDAAFGSRYTGTPLKVGRVPLAAFSSDLPVARAGKFGSYQLAVTRPKDFPPGRNAPLILCGYRNQWELIGLQEIDADTVQFVARSSANPEGFRTASVPWKAGTSCEVEISAAGLLPAKESALWGPRSLTTQENERDELIIKVDGHVVLETRLSGPEVGPNAVFLGQDPFGLGGMGNSFAGEISVLGRGKF